MNQPLESLMGAMEGPLPADVLSFLNSWTAGTITVLKPTIDVPDDILALDSLSFSFETTIGQFTFPYTHKFNGKLLEMGIAMDTSEKEAVRMGRLLLDNLRLPDVQFGRDYTDSVLWIVVNERLGHVPLIRQTLDGISHHAPYAGGSLENCASYLRSAIVGIGNSIVIQLRYQEPRAFAVFAGAVYYVLDRRHHISERRAFFPK